MRQELIFDVAPDGAVTITAKGYKGKACQDATREFIAAFGGDVISDTPTQEANERESQSTRVHSRSRS